MPYNGNGTFQSLTPPQFPAVSGTVIRAASFNQVINDLIQGLTNVITRDGQTKPTNDLPMAGKKHTGVGGATAEDQYASYGQLLNAASVMYYTSSAPNSVQRSLQGKLMERVSPEDFGAAADGVTDDTAAFMAVANAIPVDGVIELTHGRRYRITDTITLASRHLHCSGKATIVADLNDAAKDAIVLTATAVRNGSAQSYLPGCRLSGVVVLVKSRLRDGIRLMYGDHPVWDRVDVQRDPGASPIWRDGVHVESDADQHFIENLSFRSVRVHDAGRDGFRFEVPANSWGNTFINVGSYIDCEVRGAGLCEPGSPVHFVSGSTTADNKISQHNFIGGEYQTNHTATNPNPDGFKATAAVGAGDIELITAIGLTAECVPNSGSGYSFNSTNMRSGSLALFNFGSYGFTGASVGYGGSVPISVVGYLGLGAYESQGDFVVGLKGSSAAGSPTVSYQKGIYYRVGKLVTVSFEILITGWGGASGNILITGLPYPVKNDPFAQPTGAPWSVNTVSLGAGYSQVVLRGMYASSNISILKIGSSVNSAQVQVVDTSIPFQIAGSITYYVD